MEEKKVVIDGDNVHLEIFNKRFISEAYVSWLRDSAMSQIITKGKKRITIEEVESYCYNLMESDDNYLFAIIDNEDDKHIGNVRLGPIDSKERQCQFGMMIGDKSYHGRGIGTEVVKIAVKFCFDELHMRSVHLNVREDNIAAIRTYEKNNFVRKDVKSNYIEKNGRCYDAMML